MITVVVVTVCPFGFVVFTVAGVAAARPVVLVPPLSLPLPLLLLFSLSVKLDFIEMFSGDDDTDEKHKSNAVGE